MGVVTDRYLGYVVDVLDEVNKSDGVLDKYVYAWEGTKELEELGFKGYYQVVGRMQEGDIVLFYDGMSGGYAKLVYICSEQCEVSDEENNLKLNQVLRKVQVEDSVKESIYKVYSILFGETDKELDIHMEEFLHWH